MVEAWSPIAQGEVLGDEVLAKIGAEHGKSASQVALRWHIERGDIVFPKSMQAERMRENFEIFDFSLTARRRSSRSAPSTRASPAGWARTRTSSTTSPTDRAPRNADVRAQRQQSAFQSFVTDRRLPTPQGYTSSVRPGLEQVRQPGALESVSPDSSRRSLARCFATSSSIERDPGGGERDPAGRGRRVAHRAGDVALSSSRSSRLVTAPEVTIVVAAELARASAAYGGPARRSEASTSKSPSPSPASAKTGRSSACSASAEPVQPADHAHRLTSRSGRSRRHCAMIRPT